MMNEESFSQQLSGMSMLLPEEPVGVGDSWHRDRTANMGVANVLVRTDYTVRRITPDSVELAVKSTIENGEAPEEDIGMTATIESGTQSGTTTLSRANAAVANGELNQQVKTTVTFQGQVIKQDIKATTTVSVKPRAAR
jgi:hypothetical protein